ncbi:MAG: tetratricopeptide repeat protein [Thermodesulfovibrionales bacterium]
MKSQNRAYYLAGFIALMILAVYLPALNNGFVNWDDTDLVIRNTHIRSLDLTFFRWAFAFLNSTSANWHPLTWISHALDYAAWGLNPLGHHLTSIILHAMNTFLVILLVVKLIEACEKHPSPQPSPPRGEGSSMSPPLRGGDRGEGEKKKMPLTSHVSRFTLITAATTGLLFGLHPLHVEPVVWISTRADLLCALFYLLSVMMYMKYAGTIILYSPLAKGDKGGCEAGIAEKSKKQPPPPPLLRGNRSTTFRQVFNKYYLLSLFFFTLALMSKPMAVTLPIVLLLLDWYPFRGITSLKTFRTFFIGKLPFIALSLITSLIAFMARSFTGSILEDTPLTTRILVSFKSLIVYLWKMVLPFNLSSFYPYPERGVSLFSPEYGSAVVLVVVISTACILLAGKKKIWLAIWGYYVVTLLPVIGIIRLGIPAMSDRYTYLPSLGPFLLVGLFIALISEKVNMNERGMALKRFGILLFFMIFVAMAFLTVKQIGIWKNGITLWSNVIEKSPEGYFPYLNRGELFWKSGQLDEALADFDKAIAVIPSFHTLYNKLGVAYGENNSFDKAIECFNKSLAINPNDDAAYYYRGYTYTFINEYDRALEDFTRAIELNQGNVKAYVQRANLYLQRGEKGLARSDFRKACELGDENGCTALKAL